MRIGPISVSLQRKTDSSSDWQLSSSPKGEVEKWLFSQSPDKMLSGDSAKKMLDNINYSKDIQAKERFATFSYRVATPWVIMLFGVIVFQGFKIWGFDLSEKDFIAIVTSATASVLGFSYIVGRYLFGQANRDTKTEKEGLDLSSTFDKIGDLIEKFKS